MPTREPTDRELGTLLYRIAHTYLEVERGMRPPQHLQRLLTIAEYYRHRQQPAQDRLPAAGPVVPTDIGQIRFDRTLRGDVAAVVPTREVSQRWGALTIQLRKTPNGWLVSHLQRVQRRTLTREADSPIPEPEDITQRIQRVEDERGLVESAHQAVKARLADLRNGRQDKGASQPELSQQEQVWARRIKELDHELVQLRRRVQFREALDRPNDTSGSRSCHDPVDEVDKRLAKILGPVPNGLEGQDVWTAARQEVVSYRRRWSIDDRSTLLGPEAQDVDQRRDRAQVAAFLRAAARALHRNRPHKHLARPAPEFELERNLGRET